MAEPSNDLEIPEIGGEQQNPIPSQDTAPIDQDPHDSTQTTAGSNDAVRVETVNLQRPKPEARPRRTRLLEKSFAVSIGPVEAGFSSARTEHELSFCARKRKSKPQQKFGLCFKAAGAPHTIGDELPALELGRSHSDNPPFHAVEQDMNHKYIVVGIVGSEESIPREILLPTKDEDLFKQIRKAERKLRSPMRRLLSLKRVGGFSLYKCHPTHDHHSTPLISNETKQSLIELYRNHRSEKRDYNNRWNNWIHKNFNNGSTDPEKGVYALQLLLRWSPLKLVIWTSVPTVFSLVIGLWYMLSGHEGEDYIAVVQTGWTIASFVITTAALLLAVVAAISQFGDV